MSDLGGSIDELEGNLFQSVSGNLRKERLTKRDESLASAADGTLDHEPVLVDFTVVREATERSDRLLGDIVLGVGVILVLLLTDAVDLLVDLGTMMVTVLTSARDLELHAGRMPSTDTGDLAETTMGLTRKSSDTPTSDDTVSTATLGHTNDIDHGVLGENVSDADLLFKETLAVVDLGRSVLSTVDLDFLEVGLLLTDLGLLNLGVDEETHDGAVLLAALDLSVHLGGRVLLGVLGESFLLALVPVLVEATPDGVSQVTGEHGGQGAKATRSLNVSDETDGDDWRGLENADGLDDILLVELGARLVHLTDDMGHTSLESEESGKVALLGSVIPRERFELSVVMLRALLWEETQVSVTRALELTMRHLVYATDKTLM